MKFKLLLLFSIVCFQITNAQTREWMTSLTLAKVLARSENKPILMVWEQASTYPLPVMLKNKKGQSVFYDDFFKMQELNEFIWQYYIPVKVDDELYDDVFKELVITKSQKYIDSFNDDSLKIMDVNGRIITTSGVNTENILNIQKFLTGNAYNFEFLKAELQNYHNNKDFYSTFYLASKYIDFAVFNGAGVRNDILKLSNIYFNEAEVNLKDDQNLKDKIALLQRVELTKLKQDLVKNKAKKVLRRLKKIQELSVQDVNLKLYHFLQYTAHRLRNDVEEFAVLEKELSLLDKRQAQNIVDINR